MPPTNLKIYATHMCTYIQIHTIYNTYLQRYIFENIHDTHVYIYTNTYIYNIHS